MEAIKEVFFEINSFLAALKINPMYILLFVAAGLFCKIYLPNDIKYKGVVLNTVWKTFIAGSFCSIVYALLLRDYGQKDTWVEFAASYVFATSLYEMFLRGLADKVIAFAQRWTNKKLDV